MNVRERLHQLVDELPEAEALSLFEAMKRKNEPPQRISALGKYAHIPTSSEAFDQRKQHEIALEEAQAARRAQRIDHDLCPRLRRHDRLSEE